jgi:hypothetical protein
LSDKARDRGAREQRAAVKSLMSLWSCMANELAVRCCTSAVRDVKYVENRVEHEGIWFLAVTLANFGKAFERWLDQGFVAPWGVIGFKYPKHLTGPPPFLGGFLGRVFSVASGVLLDEPDIEAIYAVRQLTLAFSKIALPTDTSNGVSSLKADRKVVSEKRERRAMLEYIQCENDVREADSRMFDHDWSDFKRISTLLFGRLYTELDRKVRAGELVPKHGPGVTADRLSSNAKWNQRTWPARLMAVFPPEEFLIANERPDRVANLYKELTVVEPEAELPVRVISVPKTLKTPRIIAIEPTAMQYAQQSLFGAIRHSIEEDSTLRRMIGIDDQDPNREMARAGSFDGELATLDLSEASDRVSSSHVHALLADYPALHRAVFACRSSKASVRGHGVIPLSKFASMGSALCFPLEAMVFLTIIFVGIDKELRTPLSRGKVIKSFRERVRVFGDDLIVPRDFVLTVVHELENFGLRVNVDKSFWTGGFRESCGREYYNGQDVSIVKVRRVLPSRRLDAEGVISAVSLRNQAYWSGLWQTARWLDDYLGKLLIEFPTVHPDSPLLGRTSALGYEFQKLDPNTHGPLTKGYYVRAISPRDPLDGEGALLKCLIRTPDEFPEGNGRTRTGFDVASVDDRHLERSGRPERVSIKLGWRSPV